MIDVGMDSAIGNQTEEMDIRVIFHRLLHCQSQGRVLKEAALADHFRDSGQFLVDYSARTDIGMSDLGISHLAFRQSYCQA